jgi:DNA-directed RNA polymerase specialized sigma24 family protein
MGGFTCDEIAHMMELSVGAVMTRLSRARLALRKQTGNRPGREATA